VNATVTVRDLVDGSTLNKSVTISVVANAPPETTTTLFSADFVSDYPVFLFGGSHDRIINAGVLLDSRCRVTDIKGTYCGTPSTCGAVGQTTFELIVPTPGSLLGPFAAVAGFTASRAPGLLPNAADANIHQWHDGVNLVRTKVVYTVKHPSNMSCVLPGKVVATP
jgi:hypothetical protein